MTGKLLLLVEPERFSPDELAVAAATPEEFVKDGTAFGLGAATLEEAATPLCCEKIAVIDVPSDDMLKGPTNDMLVEALSGLLTGLKLSLALAVTVTVT